MRSREAVYVRFKNRPIGELFFATSDRPSVLISSRVENLTMWASYVFYLVIWALSIFISPIGSRSQKKVTDKISPLLTSTASSSLSKSKETQN